MDDAFKFFICAAVLFAIAMTAILALMMISLVKDDRQRESDQSIVVSSGRPVREIVRIISLVGPVLIAISSLAFGGVVCAIVLAVWWSVQNAPWVILVSALVFVLWASFDSPRERHSVS